MKPELIQAALQFLARVELRGAEAPILMAVVKSLEDLARAEPGETK